MRGRVWGKAATWKPKVWEMDRTCMCHMVRNTYPLHRGKKTRGMGGRSRGRVVRGRAWGKAATGRPELQEKDSKDMIQLAGYTYQLRRGKKTRGMGGKSRGRVVRGRVWGKAAAGRPKLQEIE